MHTFLFLCLGSDRCLCVTQEWRWCTYGCFFFIFRFGCIWHFVHTHREWERVSFYAIAYFFNYSCIFFPSAPHIYAFYTRDFVIVSHFLPSFYRVFLPCARFLGGIVQNFFLKFLCCCDCFHIRFLEWSVCNTCSRIQFIIKISNKKKTDFLSTSFHCISPKLFKRMFLIILRMWDCFG